MVGYVNGRFCYCYTLVLSEIMDYVNGRSCYYHIISLSEMISYVNKKSYYCYIAVPSGALESGKRARLTECKMRKSRLVGW